MNKPYEKPEMEIIIFESEDIMSASGNSGGGINGGGIQLPDVEI